MAREHDPHTPHSNPTDERIPHSGRHGYEMPHREFDNTSLGEAHEMGYLETPDSPAPIADRPDKKPGKGRVIIAGGVAAVAAVAAGVVGVSTLGGDKGPGERQPEASAPVDPGEADEPSSLTPEQVAELAPKPVELTVERYGTDGEALTRAYMAQFNDWMTANAVPEAKRQDYSLTLDEWVAEINKPVDDAYIDALFVGDWQQRPQLAERVQALTRGHAGLVGTNLMTTDSGNTEDTEPYTYGWDVVDVATESATDEEMVTSYRYERWDNAEMNRGATILQEGSSDGVTGGATLTWINEGGTWKIVDHEYYAG